MPERDPILMASVDEEAEAVLRDCRVFASPTLMEASDGLSSEGLYHISSKQL